MSNSYSFDFFRVPKDSLTSLEGRLEYVHTNKNQSGTAYPSTEGVSLLLFIPRALGAHKVIFNVYKEDLSYLIGSFEGKRGNADYINESYRVDIPTEFLKRGLYFFDIEISSFNTVSEVSAFSSFLSGLSGFIDGFSTSFTTSLAEIVSGFSSLSHDAAKNIHNSNNAAIILFFMTY